ncbi:MAG TPA: hypothetical protein VLQ92_13955 [Candidatus Limnocylindrales bacterium]|nr:hypothetical protein [Candidatus Limnocylindrales bacterium]
MRPRPVALLILCFVLTLASGCSPGFGAGAASLIGTPNVRMGIAEFPVGQSVVIERKVHDGNAVSVVPEVWSTVCAIAIPGGGHYVVTLQIRMPRGAWAEARMVRVGWGRDADGRDETGYHTFVARPDGRATSESFTHALAGGGTLAFEVKLHPRRKGHQVGPRGPAPLHTIVCKAHRTD